ncbi:hypothetical protein J437_LFUL002244 [Ladona fulva]|uniref:Uncharacterized protein n=1 Tax=Ladona fulva TaxID=123851 RepID=A0A8K0JYF9_LADFU|nr:hypothetical protein J437_LFUL002244 [Ladona fulva]
MQKRNELKKLEAKKKKLDLTSLKNPKASVQLNNPVPQAIKLSVRGLNFKCVHLPRPTLRVPRKAQDAH